MVDAVVENVPAAVDDKVQVIPHFGDVGIIGLTIRLQPVRNEVIDKVLAVLGGDSGVSSDTLAAVEALRGVSKGEVEVSSGASSE